MIEESVTRDGSKLKLGYQAREQFQHFINLKYSITHTFVRYCLLSIYEKLRGHWKILWWE